MTAMGVFLLSLTGCTWLSKFTYRKVSSHIVRCETKEADLRRFYGAPGAMGAKDDYMTLTWFYNVLGLDFNPDSIQRKLVVFINNKGVVVDYFLNPRAEVAINDKCSQ